MKRDESGKIQFDDRGEVEKFYPRKIIKSALFWTCQRVNIQADIERNYDKAIIAFKYVRGPHKIINEGKSYEAKIVEDFPRDLRHDFTKSDITSNCFGFAFLDGLFWIDPLLECHIYRVSVVENILESDVYRRIKIPEKNSIALFGKNHNFLHASKSDDGITWNGKVGIQKPSLENLEDNIRKYGEVQFYKREF